MQAFISFFFRQPTRKKTVAVVPSMVEVDQLRADEEHLAEEQSEVQSGDSETDKAKDMHDKEVVSAVQRGALNAGKEIGLLISSTEQREALGLFLKVSDLFS